MLFESQNYSHQFQNYRCAGWSIIWNALATFSVLFSPVFAGGACEYQKCVPDCICDLRFDDMCAMEYGNYGWTIPRNAGDEVKALAPSRPIRDYEIKSVGMRGEGNWVKGIDKGVAKILTINEDKVVGQVYFEVLPELIENGNIFVELYGDIELGYSSCSESGFLLSRSLLTPTQPGARILQERADSEPSLDPIGEDALGNGKTRDEDESESEREFSYTVFPYPTYNEAFREESIQCFPKSSRSIVGATEFAIPNPFLKTDYRGSLYFPASMTWNVKEILKFCIRVSVQKPRLLQREDDDLYVDYIPEENLSPSYYTASFIDTKFQIEGDRAQSESGQFTKKSVRIYSNSLIDSYHSQSQYVPGRSSPNNDISMSTLVHASLCGIPGTYNKGVPNYFVGEEFTICVSPASPEYRVVHFESVICENEGQTRMLIHDGFTDFATVIDHSTIGHTNLLFNTTIMHPGTLGFRSMVTTGFLQLDEESLLCTGEVRMERHVPLNQRELGSNRRPVEVVTSMFMTTVWLGKIDTEYGLGVPRLRGGVSRLGGHNKPMQIKNMDGILIPAVGLGALVVLCLVFVAPMPEVPTAEASCKEDKPRKSKSSSKTRQDDKNSTRKSSRKDRRRSSR